MTPESEANCVADGMRKLICDAFETSLLLGTFFTSLLNYAHSMRDELHKRRNRHGIYSSLSFMSRFLHALSESVEVLRPAPTTKPRDNVSFFFRAVKPSD